MKKYLLSVVLLTYFVIAFGQTPLNRNVSTAGTLSTVLTANELATVTDLTLTGKIDARDFVTMCIDMPLLKNINLSGATINSYIGTGGPMGSPSQTYPANTIPAHSFGKFSKLTLEKIVLPSNCTSIGEYAFNGCKGITDITFGNQTTSIGNFAFANCIKLTSLNLGNSSPTIGNSSFNGCSSLVSASIGDVSSIGNAAFSYCSNLTSINLGNNLTNIGEYAFSYCSKLTSIAFPNSLTNIGSFALLSCTSISTVKIPDATTVIGTSAFYSMTNLSSFSVASSNTAFSVIDGILLNKSQTTIIQCPIQKSGSYTIPLSVTTIETGAFYECANITQVIISKNVTTINSRAFGACSALKSLIALPLIPPNLYGGDCFVGNNISATYTYSTSLAAYQAKPDWRNIRIQSFPKIVVDSVKPGRLATDILQKYSSQGLKLSSITSLTVTGELNDADFAEIQNMPLLSELNIAGTKTQSGTVPTGLFANNQMVTSVYLPLKIKKIPNSCFANCKSLVSFSPLPTDTIGDYAFDNCDGYNNTGLAFPSTIKYIGKAAFRNCTNISGSIYLPDSITSIQDSTFIGCSKLSNVAIFPMKIKTISKSAFENCTSLSGIYLNSNTTSIGANAFKGCTNIIKITVAKITPPSITASSFTGIDKDNCLLYVPNEGEAAFKADSLWKEFRRTLPGGLLSTKIVSVKMGSEGTLIANSVNYINGTKITLTDSKIIIAITPISGYIVEKVEIEGIDITNYNLTADGSGKFTYERIVGANTDLIITFSKTKYNLTIKTCSGNIAQKYVAGTSPTFTITPDQGSKLLSCFYQGVDVKSSISSTNEFIAPPINGNTIMIISFGTPINSVAASLVKVYTSDNEIFVEGTESGEEIKLYSVNGIQLQSINSTGERIVIPINQKGTYMVKTNSATYKVVL